MRLCYYFVHVWYCMFDTVNRCLSVLSRYKFFDRKTIMKTLFNNNQQYTDFHKIVRHYRRIILHFFFLNSWRQTFTERLMIRIVVLYRSRPRGWVCAFCGVVGAIYATEYNKRHTLIRDVSQGRRKSLRSRYESGSWCYQLFCSGLHTTL